MAAQGQAQKVTYATQPALKTQFLTTPISQAQKLAGSQQVQTQIQVRAGGAAGGGAGLGPSQPLAGGGSQTVLGSCSLAAACSGHTAVASFTYTAPPGVTLGTQLVCRCC